MVMNMWYAVDADGWGGVYPAKPTRDEEQDQWFPSMYGSCYEVVPPDKQEGYPPLTWDSEPVEIEVDILNT